jgi:hypothetical protein
MPTKFLTEYTRCDSEIRNIESDAVNTAILIMKTTHVFTFATYMYRTVFVVFYFIYNYAIKKGLFASELGSCVFFSYLLMR